LASSPGGVCCSCTADVVTSPGETWAYAERARGVCDLSAIEVNHGDHPMLWRAPLWHAIAAEFTRVSFGFPGGTGEAAVAVAASARGARIVNLA
jgi:hypothetical protein